MTTPDSPANNNPFAFQPNYAANPADRQQHEFQPFAQPEQASQFTPVGAVQPGQFPQPNHPNQGQDFSQAGQFPYANYSASQPVAQTNSLAIASMVLSLVGFFSFFLTAPIGAILGHVSLSQIRNTGEGGRSMALAGVIVGWVLTGLGILALVAFSMLAAELDENSPDLIEDLDQVSSCREILEENPEEIEDFFACIDNLDYN